MAGASLESRLAAISDLMEAQGVDMLVAASSGLHQIDIPNPVAHLCGFRSAGPSLLLVSPDRRRVLLAAPARDRRRILGCADVEAAHAVDDLAIAFQHALEGVRKAGFIGLGELPHHLARQLLDAAPPDAPMLDAPFHAATAAKSGPEIERARRATRIAEEGYRLLLEASHPGLEEWRLARMVNTAMKEMGANDCFTLLSAGRDNRAIMPSSQRPLAEGDLILVELSPSVEGQFVQICRTAVLGEPGEDAKSEYGLLAQAMHLGIDEARAGRPMSRVCAGIDDFMSANGFAEYSRPPFIRRRGHGLGSGSVAPGDVSLDNQTILRAGMLFMIHPNQFLPASGYMMCGEPVLVTDDGPEILTGRRARLDSAGGAA